MAGAIRHGDLVHLVGFDTLEQGDVVMASLPDDRLVIHRIQRLSDGTAVLRGDSCRRFDPPVRVDQVIAKVEPRPKPTLRARAYGLVSA